MKSKWGYKNVGFWKRFCANLINLVIIFSSFLLLFAFNKSHNKNFLVFELIIGLSIIFSNYFLLPLFSKSGNIGMLFMNVKYISKNYIKSIIKRNIFSSFYWIVSLLAIFSIYNSIENHEQLHSFADINLKINRAQHYGLLFFSSLTSMVALVYLIDAFFVLFKKNKLSFLDIFSNSRYVENKKYLISINQITLYPFKVKHKEVIWTFKE